ncbi:sugar kinase [Saccharomonospora sp. NPDC006951]
MPDLVGFGEAMVLLQPPAGGTLETAPAFAVHVAGAELNACAAVAALGGSAVLCTRLGDDPFGRRVSARAAGLGVGLSAETDPRRPTGLFAKDALPDGKRRVRYYRSGSAASAMTAADAERGLALRAGAVLVSGLTIALGEGPAEMVRQVAAGAAGHGSTLVVDVNLRPALDPHGTAIEVLSSLLPHTGILLVGTDEAEPLFGTGDPERIVRLAKAGGVPEVVVKAGPAGCWWADEDGAVRHQPSLAGEVVDPVGAGDAFAGGYVTARLAGAPRGRAAWLGSRLAAGVLASTGDTEGLPRARLGRRLLAEAVAG